MARTMDLGEYEAMRGADTFRADPRGLKINWKRNLARNGQEPPIDDELKALALDMMPKKGPGDSPDGTSGQLAPVLCRALPDRTVEIVDGFRRYQAAMWLITSGTCPDFKLWYIVRSLSDAECALINVSENLHRLDPTPIQLAHSIRALHEDYGLEMDSIAARLKHSKKWLEKILNLTTLPTKIQDSVSKGKTAVTAALEIAKEPPEKHIEMFESSKDANGKVTVEAVKNRARETRQGPTPRTAKHLKSFLEPYTGKSEPSATLAKAILRYLEGRPKSEEALQKAWDQVFAKAEA